MRVIACTSSVRFRALLAGLGVLAFLAPPAGAALQKYQLHRITLIHFGTSSPEVELIPDVPNPNRIALIDDSNPDPVLKKLRGLVATTDNTGLTVILPSLSGGFIWIRTNSTTGPAPDQTGTGSTASSIDWGNLSGWTITGGSFCNSVPSYICSLADRVYLETVDPPLSSTNYDYGTWVFHGTGFTHDGGFVGRTSTSGIGNAQTVDRGVLRQDGTVPALPLLGIGAVGISVIAMGIASVRRRRL